MKEDKKTFGNVTSLKGKNILITGGLGFIGSNIAHRCVELGAKVTIYDCLNPHFGGNLYNIHEIKDSVELLFYDILDFNCISQAVVDKEIIFNCAAATSHSLSMREPLIDIDVNISGTINLLEAIRRFNKEVKLVHIGTSTQLGPLQYKPSDEKHPEFPTDIYSANKSVSEKYVLIYSKAYNLRATVVRLSNTFGPRASIHSPEFTFNNYFIGLALQRKDVSVFGEGKQKRNSIYVDDAVNALIKSSLTEQTNGETLFAVGNDHHSVAEIATATVDCIGGKLQFMNWPKERESTEIGDVIISNQKIKQMLEWYPKDNLESGLIKTKSYYEICLKYYLR